MKKNVSILPLDNIDNLTSVNKVSFHSPLGSPSNKIKSRSSFKINTTKSVDKNLIMRINDKKKVFDLKKLSTQVVGKKEELSEPALNKFKHKSFSSRTVDKINEFEEVSENIIAQNSENKETSIYQFNQKDSKFHEIMELKAKNQELQNELIEMKKELREIDEFKYALEKSKQENSIKEIKFNLFKAQIAKQKRLICRLTQALTVMKSFQKDVFNLVKIMKKGVSSYYNNVYAGNFSSGLSEEKVIDNIDNYLKNKSFLEVVNGMQEERFITFGKNFNSAFDMLKNSERKNVELKDNFVKRVEKVGDDYSKTFKITYKNSLKEFMKNFGKIFNFKTIFDALELHQKEHIKEGLHKLSLLGTKLQILFKKVEMFSLFENNKFVIGEGEPEFLTSQPIEFKRFMQDENKSSFIRLNYSEISLLEVTLSNLLEHISKVNTCIIDNKPIESDIIIRTKKELRNSIIQLIQLGIPINTELKSKYIEVKQSTLVNPIYENIKHPIIFEYNEEENNKYSEIIEKLKFLISDILNSNDENPQLQKNILNMKHNILKLESILIKNDIQKNALFIEVNYAEQTRNYFNNIVKELKDYVEDKSNRINAFVNENYKRFNEIFNVYQSLYESDEDHSKKSIKSFRHLFRKNFELVLKGFGQMSNNLDNEIMVQMKELKENAKTKIRNLEKELKFSESNVHKEIDQTEKAIYSIEIK